MKGIKMELQQEQIDNYIKSLMVLKDNLIALVKDSTNSVDLNQRFMRLAGDNPENMDLFQTLMLMQDIQNTSHKSFKESTVSVINAIINSKIDTLEAISNINTRMIVLESEKQKDVLLNIPLIGSIKRKDLFFSLISVFVILYVAYSVNPDATKSAIEVIKSVKG